MSPIRNWVSKAAVLLLPIALGACAQYAQYGMTTTSEPGPLAWDGAGPNPNLPPQRHAHNTAQAVAQSADEQADADDRLARKLVICSTCIKPAAASPDRTDVAQAANR
ncbi:hypothetical protein JQ615_40335 [Bradyrhizobium jicamae]|uniref:Lipoprotein n=1 Tax=Bradyrhizobium jicamae TaxID=280332 RepID=A0ABS5FZC2_9BRAD|nr:hypothetical protein [Bradyrhizobium jicamae]MBR0801601.1 hypothetical protein [Bradyrhizobium jicamae]MBR0937314.1 hypothetical protein [Bradyrhizobium jicamae]